MASITPSRMFVYNFLDSADGSCSPGVVVSLKIHLCNQVRGGQYYRVDC